MNDETPAQVQSDAPAPADTAPAPTNEADVQTNETPEAAVAQETTVNAEDTVVESKLYAGKYKSVDEMEKAYTELQSKFTTTASEKAELSKILADAFTAETEPAVQTQTTSYDYETEELPASNPNDAVSRDLSVLKFVMSNPDADGAAMMKVLTTDPDVKQFPSYEAKLKYAYAISQNTAKPKAIAEAQTQARNETQVKIAEKQAAQVESASTQAPPTKEEPLTRDQLRQKLKSDDGFGEILKNKPGLAGFVSKS
jgi:hypothetical protein